MNRYRVFFWIVLLSSFLVLSATGISTGQQKDVAKEIPKEATTQPTVPGIEWRHDFEKAKAESLKDGRPLIAYFTYDT